jgi:type III secretion protein J
MSGLLGKCAVIGLLLVAAGCKAALRSGLSEHEANQITLALDGAQISASKVAGPGADGARYAVQVPAAEVAQALRVLEREKLPQREAPGFEQLYGESSLVATPAEERARWAAATAGELSRSLQRIAGVADARVHLALDTSARALDAPEPAAKASVLIRRRSGTAAVDEAAVRALVAGAVDGLSADRVSVLQVPSESGATPKPSWVRIGPISVTRASTFALKALLGGALALDLLLAVTLVVVWRVHRRAQRDQPRGQL